MIKPQSIAELALITTLMFASPGHADIYKCTDAEGGLTYSQIPCPNQESVNVNTSAASAAAEAVDCDHANRFAFMAARLMQAGSRSDELFNRYGGLDSMSKGSINIINYVYGYRTNGDVSAERIAALTQAKCQARSLGDVSCEALPLSYTESIGGCNGGEAEIAPAPSSLGDAPDQVQRQQASRAATNESAADKKVAQARSEELTQQCKKKYRDQIDAIDAQMRKGFSSEQGERYRQQLRGLTQQLRKC